MSHRDSVSGRSRGARASASKEATNSGRYRPWEERFELLKAYKEEHGHYQVPSSAEYRGFKLGRWVEMQRCDGMSGKLGKDRVSQLNGIGFTWVTRESARPWDEWFELLKAYKEEHGHCRAPRSAEYRGVKLGRWVDRQRTSHKKGELSENRRTRLDDIGFCWSPLHSRSAVTQSDTVGQGRKRIRDVESLSAVDRRGRRRPNSAFGSNGTG
jgi:hypothetical protein